MRVKSTKTDKYLSKLREMEIERTNRRIGVLKKSKKKKVLRMKEDRTQKHARLHVAKQEAYRKK